MLCSYTVPFIGKHEIDLFYLLLHTFMLKVNKKCSLNNKKYLCFYNITRVSDTKTELMDSLFLPIKFYFLFRKQMIGVC